MAKPKLTPNTIRSLVMRSGVSIDTYAKSKNIPTQSLKNFMQSDIKRKPATLSNEATQAIVKEISSLTPRRQLAINEMAKVLDQMTPQERADLMSKRSKKTRSESIKRIHELTDDQDALNDMMDYITDYE
jgi:hypothetical protein